MDDPYQLARDICGEAALQGNVQLARNISDAMIAGATSTEILFQLRWIAKEQLSTGTQSGTLTSQLSRLIATIDQLLGE